MAAAAEQAALIGKDIIMAEEFKEQISNKRKKVPVIGFAAYSGTGKTTLIEKIIPLLKRKGLTVAVVKHDAHGLVFDTDGKDSSRFSKAGAAYSIVSGPGQAAVFVGRSLEPEEAISFAQDADLVIVEGYKRGNFSQIGINRMATGKGFTDEMKRFVAVVTDETDLVCDIPVFDINDAEGIADFIFENKDSFTAY